jgi:hypothetical protein
VCYVVGYPSGVSERYEQEHNMVAVNGGGRYICVGVLMSSFAENNS